MKGSDSSRNRDGSISNENRFLHLSLLKSEEEKMIPC